MPELPLHGGPHEGAAVDVDLDPWGNPPSIVVCRDADGRSVEYGLDSGSQSFSYLGSVSPEDEA